MKPPFTYVFAEDHPLIRQAFISQIKTDAPHATLVAEAANGIELLNAIAELKQPPDIALIDLSMPIMNGAEAAKIIVEKYPTIKILIQSIVEDENSILNVFNIGVHGFIGKTGEKLNFSPVFDEVLETGVLKNKYYRRASIEKLDWKRFAFIGKVSFTHKEISFLKYKLTNLSLKEIAQEMHVAEKTVENYRDAAYDKLNVKSRAELVAKLLEMGFLKEDPTNP